MPSIIVISGAQRGQCVTLGDDPVTIGRDASCELTLADDERTSRRHLEIGWDAQSEAFFARDLGSTNGVIVADKRLAPEALLRNGDVVIVGDTRMMFTQRDFPDRRSALAYCDEHPGEAGPTVSGQHPVDEPWKNA